jgi:hypothetical protein
VKLSQGFSVGGSPHWGETLFWCLGFIRNLDQ